MTTSNYYHCLDCDLIPNIRIDKNNLIVECVEKKTKSSISISEYYKFYVNQINFNIQYAFLRFYICVSHQRLFCSYCNDCQKNICNLCKIEHDNKKHTLLPDENLLRANEDLKKLILMMRDKIKEIRKMIDKIESYLSLYEILLLGKNSVFSYEILNNFRSLKILENIKEKRKAN